MRRAAFPHKCRRPECDRLTRQTYCAEHRWAKRAGEQDRGKTAARGYGGPHRRWRARVLAKGLCTGWPYGTRCPERPTVADHIVPKDTATREQAVALARRYVGPAFALELEQADDWKRLLRFSLDNGQPMCAADHNRKTAEGL